MESPSRLLQGRPDLVDMVFRATDVNGDGMVWCPSFYMVLLMCSFSFSFGAMFFWCCCSMLLLGKIIIQFPDQRPGPNKKCLKHRERWPVNLR